MRDTGNSDNELVFRYTAAQQEVLSDPLNWLLGFLQIDLEGLRPWNHGLKTGWRSLGDEIIFFSMPTGWTSSSQFAFYSDLAHAPAKRTIEKIQRELRRGVSMLMRNDDLQVWRIPKLSPSVALIRGKNGKVFRSYRSKILRDRFFMAVTDLLQSRGSRIGTCTVCQRLFQIIKRRTYCSSRCSQKRRTQKYRAKHKDALRVRRRQRLEAKMRARYGPKIKIAVRPARES